MKNPGAKVPGTNDFACKPRKGTHPVVLIPGTSEDAFITWSYYGPPPQGSRILRLHVQLQPGNTSACGSC